MPTTSTTPLGNDPWLLAEPGHEAARAALHETLFALGNGRIGVRGAHEEGALWPGTSQDAIYINGFHDVEDIHYAENGYGLARRNQFIVNVPNGKAIRWSVDGEAFDPAQGRIEDYRRELDMREGVLTRGFTWVSPKGRRVAVASRRVVCFVRAQVYAIEFSLTPLHGGARIQIESTLDARGRTIAHSDDPRVGSAHAANALVRLGCERDGERVTLTHRTRRSGLMLASAVTQSLRDAAQRARASVHACGGDDHPGMRFAVDLQAGERVVLDKFCALVSTLDAPQSDLVPVAAEQLAQAHALGFEALVAEQRTELARWWRDADIEIEGDASLQQGMRFDLLHLLQSSGRDGRTNIAAKGVTGSGYDGHYFWDTEIYIFPVLLHTQPALARKLLEYRYSTLDAARARARELNHPHGALFPWRTIAGAECSAYFPAGTAQVHINADIAFAVKRYWEATGDDAFMAELGAELVFETARIWITHGHYAERDGRRCFQIHTVTGPDEYTALVDNNFYTNAMARMHLRFAGEAMRWLTVSQPDALRRIEQAIALGTDEPAQWHAAAQAMYLPYNDVRGIHPQDDAFLSKPRWDVASIDPGKRPLLLHYHSLVIYRHQVCKQADVLLALLLLADQFDLEDKRRDFDYYEPLTTHDSSLSRCIFGIVASEVGYHDKAYDYFVDGVRTDLDDHHGNTASGVHTAAMAGAWLGVVAGFAGLRMQRAVPTFAPRLPRRWTRYAFKLRVGASQLQVCVDASGCHYQLVDGVELALKHCGTDARLTRAHPLASFPMLTP